MVLLFHAVVHIRLQVEKEHKILLGKYLVALQSLS